VKARRHWHDLAEQWRCGGSFIDETSHRREAFNIMLSMPSGTDPQMVQRAAREFAQAELGDHRYVMDLHDHQAKTRTCTSACGPSPAKESGSIHARRTCSAGARRSRRGCVAGESMPRRRDRARAPGPQLRAHLAHQGCGWGAGYVLRRERQGRAQGSKLKEVQGIADEAWNRIIEGLSRSASPEDKASADHVDRFLRETFANDSKHKREVGLAPQLHEHGARQTLNVVASEQDGSDMQR
jgi:hypothetical protein